MLMEVLSLWGTQPELSQVDSASPRSTDGAGGSWQGVRQLLLLSRARGELGALEGLPGPFRQGGILELCPAVTLT